MTVRFHPSENQSAYTERVLAILVQAALPQVMERPLIRDKRKIAHCSVRSCGAPALTLIPLLKKKLCCATG